MQQISRRMEMIRRLVEDGMSRGLTNKHTARGFSDLYHVFTRKQCILCSTLRHGCLTLLYVTSIRDFFLPLEQSRTALLACRLAASRLCEPARWQLLTWAHLEWSSRKLVSYSFACHGCSCKVKYFWKVANVWVRIRGEDNVLPCLSQHCHSMSPTSYQLATRRMKQANCKIIKVI